MPNDFIEREILFNTLQLAAKASGAMGRHDSAGIYASAASLVAEQPAADVVPVVRCGKDRLTKLGANGIYGLVKVKDNEQEVDSPYKNTLAAIVECFQRLAEYENAEFGTDGGENHAD